MKKKILLGVLTVLVLIVAFAYVRTRPSGDINDYEEFFVNQEARPIDARVKVTFFGVSTLLLDDGQSQILIDGFFSRPSMASALFSDISSDTSVIGVFVREFDMKRVKGIFVTHSHYDHGFDAGHVALMTGATLYGSESTLNIARGAGVGENQLQLYEPQKEISLGDFRIRVVPSLHSPGNTLPGVIGVPLHQPASFKAYTEGGAYDFLVTHGGRKMYIKPSPNFIVAALDSLDVDALFIGIATITKYGPEWTDQFYKENVTAVEPSLVVPIHWDNFFQPVSNELVMLPKFSCDAGQDFDYFIKRTKADNIDFRILQGTQSIYPFY